MPTYDKEARWIVVESFIASWQLINAIFVIFFFSKRQLAEVLKYVAIYHLISVAETHSNYMLTTIDTSTLSGIYRQTCLLSFVCWTHLHTQKRHLEKRVGWVYSDRLHIDLLKHCWTDWHKVGDILVIRDAAANDVDLRPAVNIILLFVRCLVFTPYDEQRKRKNSRCSIAPVWLDVCFTDNYHSKLKRVLHLRHRKLHVCVLQSSGTRRNVQRVTSSLVQQRTDAEKQAAAAVNNRYPPSSA